VNSVIGRAKQSVDNTVDAYMGRAAFAVCILGALCFALAGTWIILVDRFGTTVACFALAGVLLLISLIVHATVIASERKAKRDIEAVERSIEKTGLAAASALPIDLSTAITILPLVMPLLRSVKSLLPYLLIGGLVASYFLSRPAPSPTPPVQA
jgi:uncharacterized membrane protein